MSRDLAFLVPVLQRPHRVAPLLDSIEATTPGARVVFLLDGGDLEESAAVEAESGREQLQVDGHVVGGGYAKKTNKGVAMTDEPLLFLGADDLRPIAGWLEAAASRLSPPVGVVGVNDLMRRRPQRRGHATHFLMTREYAQQPTIDGGRGPLHEGYAAWYCDDELIATAQKREAYAYAADAHVEHLHPFAHKAPDDDVYRRGQRLSRHDHKRFVRRQPLWA